MKKQVFILTVCLFCAFALQAQNNIASISSSEFQRDFVAFSGETSLQATATRLLYNEEKYKKFKKMRTTGIVLTGVGAGLLTAGIVLISSGINEGDDYNLGTDNVYGNNKVVGGMLCTALGVTATGGGITLWAIGNNKMKKYSAINLQRTSNGIGVAYNF